MLALVLVSAPAARAQGASEIERVQTLYRDGRAAREQGDLERALALLREAWAIRRTHDGAASLSQVEFELGLVRDAAEHLDYACRHLPADADPKRARRLLDALEQVRQKVVSLRIEVEPAAAEVSLDGRLLGRGEGLERELFVDPGRHGVVAVLAGFVTSRSDFEARAGERRSVRIALVPAREPPARTSPPPRASARPASPGERPAAPAPSQVPSWFAFGASAASLVVSASFWFAADGERSAADDRLALLSGTGRCGAGTPYPRECAGIRAALASERDLRVVSGVALGVAVGSAVTGLVLWPRNARAPRLEARVDPAARGFSADLAARF